MHRLYFSFYIYFLKLGSEVQDKKEDLVKETNETHETVEEDSNAKSHQETSENAVKFEPAQQSQGKQMSFSNRIIMNQLDNPRELAHLVNLTSLPKYQLETASKIATQNTLPNSEFGNEPAVEQLELEAKRHQQIHMLIKLAR